MRISKNQMIGGIFGIAGAAYGLGKLAETIGLFWTKALIVLAIGIATLYIVRRLRNR